jgi:hypothetical protein
MATVGIWDISVAAEPISAVAVVGAATLAAAVSL